LEQEDFDLITANSIDPDATEDMPVRYGIAVNRTELKAFPWDGQILDDPADTDFDYQPLVGVRVNEPVAIYATSADKKYYQVSTSCCPGWVQAEDIAICKDKEEWLSAWDLPAEKRLVFWGDKMYTDYSNSASQTVCRLISMGTVLERMDDTDPDALVINRLPLHNYAVYLPVRNEDGSYGKTPALINARERVSEDYLPLTAGNLAKVALASLGDAYGWGGGLNNEDCTSLNHSVFCCFGLDLPRNGTWQWPLDFAKAEITNYTLEEKEDLLDTLPMGTLLNFPGHQMMYLGKTAGSYYVVSTVSSIMSPWSGKRQRTRDVQINTLDIRRANGKTWMQALNKVVIPWLYLNEGEEYAFPELPVYHEYTAFCLEKGLIDAYPTGYFLPERPATTAEAVEMLWRIAGKPEPGENAEPFEDVATGSEHEKAALWARETGVYTGKDGKFRGGAELTWFDLKKMTGKLLNGEDIGENPAAGAAVTRAGLAKAGQAAFTIRAEQIRTVIEEMVVYYSTYGAGAEQKTSDLLDDLHKADPAAGAKWEKIMNLWKTVNTDPEIHEGILPDGLPETDELCLVVLGFQLNPDGSMKDELIERLKVAKASAEKYPNALIVCTGGGTAADNPDATEAGRMAEWLIANGIPADRVIVEDQSLTTAQNAIFTWNILTKQYPQVKQLAIISSDYHIATGTLLFGAEAVLQAEEAGKEIMTVVSNAAWHAPSGTLSPMFQAGALIELSGDKETAFEIYYETYDIHELPPLKP
ncbi:MAG: ElyC/SanA/YdcF family protein, partial [Clostridia bacterium]